MVCACKARGVVTVELEGVQYLGSFRKAAAQMERHTSSGGTKRSYDEKFEWEEVKGFRLWRPKDVVHLEA